MSDERTCVECGGSMPDLPEGKQARANAMRAKYCSKRCKKRLEGRNSARKRDLEFREALTKVERLAIAGAMAPVLRSKTTRRRVNVVDVSGNVVRQITDVELARGIAARAGVEFAVEPGARADHVICDICCKPVPIETSPPRKRHVECRFGRCADCSAPLLSPKTTSRAKKNETVPRCLSCSVKARTSDVIACGTCGVPLSRKASHQWRSKNRACQVRTPRCRTCARASPEVRAKVSRSMEGNCNARKTPRQQPLGS